MDRCLGRDPVARRSSTRRSRPVVRKIEDPAIETQVVRLQASKAANEVANAAVRAVSPQKSPTSFDDFQKMDIRIGTILAAERVPKTEKLLKLTVDTGIDQRTVVSGIAAHYDPEKIVGQQVTILVNLEPRKIKGIESQGMILMAENAKGELAFSNRPRRWRTAVRFPDPNN